MSDGLIDRNGKPIGTDFSNVYAAGSLSWQGRAADAYSRRCSMPPSRPIFGGREVPLLRLAISAVLPAGRDVHRGRRSLCAGGLAIWLAR